MSKYIDNRYFILKSMDGNNAYVFHAIDKATQGEPEVVVKLFSMNHNDRLNARLFSRETECLERLSHANIVRLIDAGRHEDSPYLVMDYIKGETLEKYWQHRTGDVQATVRVLGTLLDAVSYAHSEDVVHRDLKPRNIIVDDDDEVHIIDFGTSKIVAELNMGLTVKDFITVEFASPEQLAHSDVDFRTDLYSLGAIAYWMLTGKVKADGEELSALVRALDVQQDVKEFLTHLVETDPDDRPATSFAARRRLMELANHLDQESIAHCLLVSPASVQKLYTLGEIGAASEGEARDVLQQDLAQAVYAYVDSNVYYILGRRCKLTCSIDPTSRAGFLVRSVSVPPNQFLEGEKERATTVNAQWKVLSAKAHPAASDEFALLLERLQVDAASFQRKKEVETANKDLVRDWESVLRLQRQLATYNGLRIEYIGYRFSDQDMIEVTLAQPLDELLRDSSESRIFSMSQKGRYDRQVDVGTFVDLVGSRLTLLVKRGLSEEAIRQTVADRGVITVNTAEVRALLQRQQRALDTIKYGESVNSRLPQLLRDPASIKTRTAPAFLDFKHADLDTSKQHAVRQALATNDIFLVQGPPGTGKTTFIAELVHQILCAEPKARLLITSQSHVAVDQALEYVAKVISTDTKVVRVGREEKVSGEASRFVLEKQLKNWLEEIRLRSDKFAAAATEALGADTRALDLLRLLDEVDVGWGQVEGLKADLADVTRGLEVTSHAIRDISNARELIDHLSERLKASSASMPIEHVVRSVQQFREDLTAVGESYLDRLVKNSDIYQRHEELTHRSSELMARIQQLTDDMNAGFELLQEGLRLPEATLGGQNLSEMRLLLLEQTEGVGEAMERRARVERVRQEWLGRLGKQDELDNLFVTEVQILAGTCVGVAPYLYRGGTEYDWVIIDEAARATTPELLVPAVRGKRIVLVGDHHQLPPVLDRNMTAELLAAEGLTVRQLEKTLFEYLFDNLPNTSKARLTDQWRMHPGIGNMISHVFYDRALVTRAVAQPRSYALRWGEKTVIWLSTSHLQDRHEQPMGTSFVNRCEAKLIDTLLSEMEEELSQSDLRRKVGVISGYASQKEALLSALDPSDDARWKSLDLRIGTVDAFQGQETDVIFYSMVRSNRKKDLGFLADARRLNVALSRARHLLIIVGDHDLAASAHARPSNPYADVVSYMKKNPEYCLIEEAR